MGPVSSSVMAAIKRQVDEQQLVVWFDPERHYQAIADALERDGIPVERFDGSVFRLRRRLERWLSAAERPRLVVYVPAKEDDLRWPLAELVAAAVVMKPGQQPVQRNTRLAVVTRAALSDRIGAEALDSLIKQVEAGSLLLADLDSLAERGTSLTGILSVVVGTSSAGEIALRFLADEALDQQLTDRKAEGELRSLLEVNFGFRVGDLPLSHMRESFERYLLGAELRTACGDRFPESLAGLPFPATNGQHDAVLSLVNAWRNRRDLQTAYAAAADRVEDALGLDDVPFDFEALRAASGFRGLEERLQSAIEGGLLNGASHDAVGLIEQRQAGFWSSVDAELLSRWALDGVIARLLLMADAVTDAINSEPTDLSVLMRAYVDDSDGREPWCVLDTLHRQMEQRVHQFDIGVSTEYEALEQVIARARQRYMEAAGLVAQVFVSAFEEQGLAAQGYGTQRRTFQACVAPAVRDGKTAYILVDGLRYEMARELHRERDSGLDGDLQAVLGTLPSITEIGMSALLPGAEDGIELEAVAPGRLGARIRGTLLRDRKDRLQFLEQAIDAPMFAGRLSEMLPPSKKTREALDRARLIVLTATDELDGLCERGNIPMARRLMEDVLGQIRRALRYLFDLGVTTAVVTSDHGFVFGEMLDSATTLEAPGGQTLDLHRRVWVGKGGAASAAIARFRADAVGLSGDFEIAVPRGLEGFKVPGGHAAYFHGGASPAEIVIPVWVVRPANRAGVGTSSMTWELTPGSRTVSTRFLSVQISGAASGLFSDAPPTVRVEVRSGKTAVSRPVASSYGFQDARGVVELAWGDEQHRNIRPNTVTLMLDIDEQVKAVKVLLLDADTDRVLATCDVPVSIAGF